MKQLTNIAVIAVLLLWNAFAAGARTHELVEQEKKYSGHYNVNGAERLVIDNVHGNVHINTWDKNEITVDVTVKAKGRTETEAKEILDRISIVMSSNENGGHEVFCKTVLEPIRSSIHNSEMSINYVVNMPAKNAVDVTDKFGDVYLGDCSGRVRMNVSYGALNMQRISGSDNKIRVAFGSAMVDRVEKGTFDISYSSLTLDNADNVDITNKFGSTHIGSVHDLTMNQKYGSIDIGSVDRVSGTVDYANFEAGNLEKSAELTAKYCGRVDFKSVNAGVELMDIKIHYSNMACRLAEGVNLAVDVTTSYSAFKRGSRFPDFAETSGRSGSSEHYRGRIGKGTGTMQIDAHYSDIGLK